MKLQRFPLDKQDCPMQLGSCMLHLCVYSGGSRISPRRGRQLPGGAPTYDFAKFSQKLHEIERIWTPGEGGGASKILLCRFATGLVCFDSFWEWFEGEGGLGSNIKIMMISYLEARPLLCSTGKTWKHIFTDVYFTMKYQSNDRGINQSSPSRSKLSVRLYKTILSIQLKIVNLIFLHAYICAKLSRFPLERCWQAF